MQYISTLISLMIVILAEFCWAQDFLASQGKPGKQPFKFFVQQAYDVWSNEHESRQLDGKVAIPFYQSEASTLALVGKAQQLHFESLPASNDFVAPQDLYEYQYGVSWAFEEIDESTWGANVNVGSASDKPFDGSDVTAVSATMTRKVNDGITNAWLFLLNYSNNRSFLNNIPLPGLAYIFSDVTKTYGGVAGLPFFSYWWRPSPKVFFSVFTLFPSVFRTQVGYMIWGPLQANLKLEYGQQVYMRNGRSNRDERIFYETKKAAFSLKSFFGRQTFVEFELARVFDRSMFDGESTFDPTSERLHLPDHWQTSAALQLSF